MGTPPLLFPCAHVAVLFYCSVQCCHNKASGGRAASWWVAPLAPNTADCMWATRLPLTYWLQAVRQRGGCNRHTLDRFQQVGARDQVPLSPPTHTSSQHTHTPTDTHQHASTTCFVSYGVSFSVALPLAKQSNQWQLRSTVGVESALLFTAAVQLPPSAAPGLVSGSTAPSTCCLCWVSCPAAHSR